MIGRAIPFVPIKAVVRISRVQVEHEPVTKDLGNDGRGRDTGTATITADDTALGDEKVRNAERVHQREVWKWRQPDDRLAHRRERGVMNIEPIDRVCVAYAYSP